MKIIIPMSGSGNRFIQKGYKEPKPLIKVHGKPMIEYVINLFPNESDFIFICRDEHLRSTNMADVLRHLKPTGTILEVEPAKLGPVYAVAQAFHLINDEEPVIVNYCDFYMDWDYEDFKKNVKETGCDGDVVSYIGFHPHLLHENNFYASSKVDGNHNILEIREKYSFTSDKTHSPQSCGTYYFKKGSYIKKYFQQLMDEKIELNGEYYVSLIYNLMIRDRLKIHVYDKVYHFLQWGTPEDLEEYLYWSDIFERLAGEQNDD